MWSNDTAVQIFYIKFKVHKNIFQLTLQTKIKSSTSFNKFQANKKQIITVKENCIKLKYNEIMFY